MRTLWLNPAAGAAGDMLLGTLVDAGADRDHVLAQLELLGVDGWTLSLESVTRRELTATHAVVACVETGVHRRWSEIDALLADAGLSTFVADGARSSFRALGDAEATVHGIDIDRVHFHEVGAVDAIVDIVGTWAALESLRVDEVVSAPIGLGYGATSMAHGTVPVPAPAVLELLADLPVTGVDFAAETVTPTGAALLRTMVGSWGAPPPGVLAGSGRGAGSMDPPGHANVVVAAVIDDGTALAPAEAAQMSATVIECNLDDVTPEVIAHVIDRALATGADDAWVTPIVMKKSRPAHLLSVLCTRDKVEQLAELIASETGTLGYRITAVAKTELPRRTVVVDVDGHPVRIKIGPHSSKPEHDDVAAAAIAAGRTHRDISAEALRLLTDEV